MEGAKFERSRDEIGEVHGAYFPFHLQLVRNLLSERGIRDSV